MKVKHENSRKENQIKQLTRDVERLNLLMNKKQAEIEQITIKKEKEKEKSHD